jgi:hypothetical protein
MLLEINFSSSRIFIVSGLEDSERNAFARRCRVCNVKLFRASQKFAIFTKTRHVLPPKNLIITSWLLSPLARAKKLEMKIIRNGRARQFELQLRDSGEFKLQAAEGIFARLLLKYNI